MKKQKSVDRILDFVIAQENEAHIFYSALAAKQADTEVRALLFSLAKDEEGHRRKIEAIKKGDLIAIPEIRALDLDLEEFILSDPSPGELVFEAAVQLAMQKELKAFELYSRLAELTTDKTVRNLFVLLSQEEAVHKIKLEIQHGAGEAD